jgi:hypothetical protein
MPALHLRRSHHFGSPPPESEEKAGGTNILGASAIALISLAGIPVTMPGERFGGNDSGLLRYLASSEQIDARFPGFETEIHGIHIESDGTYRIPCLSSADWQPSVGKSTKTTTLKITAGCDDQGTTPK